MTSISSHVNIMAVIVSAIAYFALGALWYGVLFGKRWKQGLEQQGIRLKEPTKERMVTTFVMTFLAGLTAVVVTAVLMEVFDIRTVDEALVLGMLLSIGYGTTALGIAFAWEGKPLQIFLIDAGYHILGVNIAAVILALWR